MDNLHFIPNNILTKNFKEFYFLILELDVEPHHKYLSK